MADATVTAPTRQDELRELWDALERRPVRQESRDHGAQWIADNSEEYYQLESWICRRVASMTDLTVNEEELADLTGPAAQAVRDLVVRYVEDHERMFLSAARP